MKASDHQLIIDYPLTVQFPDLDGPYLLLNWWCYDEQNHVTVARTEEQIIQIFKRLLEDDQYSDAKPVAIWSIDIVRPPDEMLLRIAKLRRSQEIDSFGHWISRSLLVLEEAGRPLPKGFTKCSVYEPNEDGDVTDDFMRERHYNCRSCVDGYCFDSKQLYTKARDDYRIFQDTAGRRGYIRGRPRASTAGLANPDRPLFQVVDRHGDHSDGSCVERINKYSDSYFQDVKFFCHATKLKMPAPLLKMRADLDVQLEALHASRAAESKAESEARERQTVDQLQKFFDSL
jgi:hypothetical protein